LEMEKKFIEIEKKSEENDLDEFEVWREENEEMKKDLKKLRKEKMRIELKLLRDECMEWSERKVTSFPDNFRGNEEKLREDKE